MNSLYVQGESLPHRLSPRLKLAALLIVSLAVFLTRSPLVLAAAALASAGVYASLRIGWRQSWLRLRPILLTILVVAAAALLLNSAAEGLIVLLRLTTLMLFAATVTATTPVSAFMEEITRATRPLERLGLVDAADIGLAVGLVIRFVPEVVSRYHGLAEAHRARGLKLRPATVVVPLIIQTLKSADEIAGAIDARGIRRHNADIPGRNTP